MKEKEPIIAIIPARGGSKGLPRKNIQLLNGKPLIAYTIEAARKTRLVNSVYVSTEDEEIASISRKFGANIIDRPPALAGDFISSNECLKHAVTTLRQDINIRIVAYLQTTDIFRKRGIIDKVIQTLLDHPEYDSAFAAYPTHKNFWERQNGIFVRLKELEDLPRQQKQPICREDTGIACATLPDIILKHGRVGKNPIAVSHDEEYASIDIHTADDLWLAEQVVRKYKDTGRYEF